MDSLVILVAVAATAIAVVLGLFLLRERRRPPHDGERESELAALSGRLAQMAESQAAVQARITDQLQAQERQMAKAV
ncbi:MAG TPA: hypothetical protein EYP07_13755, partial [Kiloniellaceae bacterium]|nr:hypothetical protein [Kiloniellaceae bacterium]